MSRSGGEPSEPYPETTRLAAHFAGLFATDALSANIGGHVPGILYAVDLNRLGSGRTGVYLAKESDGVPQSLLPYAYLADAGPEATAKLRDLWSDVERLSVADPPSPDELKKRAEEFAAAYPGVARLRADYPRRFLGGVAAPVEPEPVPAGVFALYRAFERIAPSFIEARGQPEPGADAAGGAEAQRLA